MSGYNAMVRRDALKAACLDTYDPQKYAVVVNDTFDQWRYRIAYSAIWGPGLGMPTFFILCAEYFIKNNRKLKEIRRTIQQIEMGLRKRRRREKREEDKARKEERERWENT
jgi:hypothetical protein